MSDEPEAAGRITVPGRRAVGGLLRTRNYGLFWAGESVSGFGSAITTVALPLVAVSVLHASAGMVALLTAANWLPWLLVALPAGTWVDRWPRRPVLLSLRTGPEPRPARAGRPGMVRQITEGLEYFRHGGFLLPMLAVAALMNFAMLGVFALRVVFLVRAEGAAPGTAGALATAFGIRAAMWALAILLAVTPLPLLATPMRTMRDFPALPARP